MNDAPPPVTHSIRCICETCCRLRRVEAEAGISAGAARQEELRGPKRAAFFEKTIGPVYSRLGAPCAPRPGTARALANRYLYEKRRPRPEDVDRDLLKRAGKVG